jgi:glycopeptide antibiotics resistance protein
MIHYFQVRTTKNLLVRKNIFFWIALSWTGIVLFFCLIQSNNIPSISISNLDKYVHSFFHFVFTILWFVFFKKQLKPESSYLPWKTPFFFSVLFGIGIEVCQELFTATRKADVQDFFANLSGAILAVIAIMVYSKIKKK